MADDYKKSESSFWKEKDIPLRSRLPVTCLKSY